MELVLTADPTRTTGTRPSRRLRREGQIPAVVYGLGGDPVSVAVDWRELRACLKTDAGVNAVIHLDIDGARHLSIVKDIQRHPVRRDVIHVDFLRVDPTAQVSVDVPIVIEGTAKKVAAMQGIVDQQMFTMTVSVRPDQIPNEITIDVTDLDIGDVITVGDVRLPAGVTAVSDADSTVIQGSATRSTIMLRKGASPEELAAAEEADIAGEDAAEAVAHVGESAEEAGGGGGDAEASEGGE
jgi:large subunit ribosomal protein L25